MSRQELLGTDSLMMKVRYDVACVRLIYKNSAKYGVGNTTFLVLLSSLSAWSRLFNDEECNSWRANNFNYISVTSHFLKWIFSDITGMKNVPKNMFLNSGWSGIAWQWRLVNWLQLSHIWNHNIDLTLTHYRFYAEGRASIALLGFRQSNIKNLDHIYVCILEYTYVKRLVTTGPLGSIFGVHYQSFYLRVLHCDSKMLVSQCRDTM